MLKKNNVSALVVVDNKLLLTKRAETEDFLPGVWELPGGKLEKDESLQQALFRELKEETGIDVEKNFSLKEVDSEDYVITSKKDGSRKSVTETTYLILLEDFPHVKLSPEHSEFDWVDIKKIDSYFSDKSDMMFIRLKRVFNK